MIGEWKDYLVHPDGRRELVDEGRNLIVNGAFIVVAMCLKQDPAFAGVMYWALGDGNTVDTAGWDAGVLAGTTVPVKTDAALANEIFRKAVLPADITFVDGAGNLSGTPTNRLKITVTFLEAEPSAGGTVNLREWGLYGGNATGAAGSGYLINRKVHKTYAKSNLSQLERVLVFTF